MELEGGLMYKEFIIIVIVIVMIVWLDISTNQYTKETLEILSSEFNVLRKYVLEENREESEKQFKKIKQNCEERYKILAFYIEHDELEKVETEMIKLEAEIYVGELESCISEIRMVIFILEHIQDKEKLQLQSIF